MLHDPQTTDIQTPLQSRLLALDVFSDQACLSFQTATEIIIVKLLCIHQRSHKHPTKSATLHMTYQREAVPYSVSHSDLGGTQTRMDDDQSS